jgi:transcriptional regulator with XRE-family HTH domain
MSKIGERVRRARKRAGESQDSLAIKIRVNRSYLSLIENGKCSPTFEFLERISTGLAIPVEDLVMGEEISGLIAVDGVEGPVYRGLAELLDDQEQMLLMNPSREELDILKGIRVDTRFRPSKRFFVEALLDHRKTRVVR